MKPEIDLPPLPNHPRKHHDCEWEFDEKLAIQDYARAAVEADRQRRGVPDGWRIVPIDPTIEMLDAGDEAMRDFPPSISRYETQLPPKVAYYRAMINAAPQPAEPCVAPTLHNANSGAQNGIQATQPAEPVKLPSDDERAAQGLPPYNPRLPTDEEMKRLTENGRKAWGKDDTEPVRVPSDAQRWHRARTLPRHWWRAAFNRIAAEGVTLDELIDAEMRRKLP